MTAKEISECKRVASELVALYEKMTYSNVDINGRKRGRKVSKVAK